MTIERDRYFLEMAPQEAEKALEENTYPVGAVIVDENDQVIATGRNRVHTQHDATAHAEIDAIRKAGKSIFLAKVNRKKFTMYTSLEPCPMCTGGILFAKIQRVVWLLNDDMGFGGYKKIQGTNVFDKKFHEVEAVEEPYDDLKEKQMELMKRWSSNPNNVTQLRKAVIQEGRP
ncbi:nucleoside deaminase [Rossellomorea sp. AcN35-11]|nr:nucleoside deaminase [Rossellomorea aquimaris]WJV29811.1 nucleoside deaminase [Rossellomorea sp. AcN35-11]